MNPGRPKSVATRADIAVRSGGRPDAVMTPTRAEGGQRSRRGNGTRERGSCLTRLPPCEHGETTQDGRHAQPLGWRRTLAEPPPRRKHTE